jgi:phosphopantothenoylcysteine decarboxylase/phosphopantothenate--cysteine ligase
MDHIAFRGFLGRRLHLGVTGSVAAYKALELVRLWRRADVDVGATLTPSAVQFVQPLSFQALGADPVHTAMFPVGDDLYAHLHPGRAAHALVVAPATATILAKLAHGLADDMLACQALSFPGPLILAPAMNHRMWEAEATRANWETLRSRGHVCVEPECGDLACGDEGAGRLAAVETIFLHGLRALARQDLAGRKVLLTLGPTREHWDLVRFWSNPSTGRMGAALAVAAWLRGAEVHAVCGPVDAWLPPGIHRVDVQSAREMHQAALDLWPGMDIGCCTAAVADFRPVPHDLAGKYKKASATDGLRVELTPNPDILKDMGAAKRDGQRLVGFAAEAAELEANALRKLESKRLDLLVANPLGRPGAGFAAPTNQVHVFDSHGRHEEWPSLHKTEVAWRVWDCLLQT